MKHKITLFMIVIAACAPAYAHAPMDIHVTVGKVSEVVFGEKVAKIIKGGSTDSVLVEVLDNSIYVLPKTNSPSDIFVTGVSGESYPLNLIVGAQHDIRVEVSGSARRLSSQSSKLGPLELMKEVLLGHEPAGSTILKGGQTIALEDQNLKLTVQVIYDLPHMAAYILKAQNLTDNNLVVPLEQITFPNLLAITADQDMLKPQGEVGDATRVYLIRGK
jgi:hypothetical protein